METLGQFNKLKNDFHSHQNHFNSEEFEVFQLINLQQCQKQQRRGRIIRPCFTQTLHDYKHTHTHKIKPQQQYHKANTHTKVIARHKIN